MGLISVAKTSLSSVLADQWKEFFYCDSLSNDILMAKGVKKNGKGNTKATDNIITNGSTIIVNEGQCMLIVSQGKIVEVCAEPGEFTYDTSSSPTVFDGGLGAGIAASFKEAVGRFTYGGVAPKDQRIYFVNTKEITENKYGTPNPIPFRVVDTNIGLDIDVAIRCFGTYSFRITNPVQFFANVCGNVAGSYNRNQLEGQMKSELLTALQPAFARVSEAGVRYSALPAHTIEISNALNDILSARWSEQRGIEIVSFAVNSVNANPEDEAMIKELQRMAVYKNPNMAAAQLAGAQADAMKAAASNSNGAMMGFMGMNMAAQMGGMDAGALYQMGQQQAAAAPAPAPAAPAADSWTCSCGTVNTGKFCAECGSPKPAETTWTCSCGAVNKGKFCSECGSPKPDTWTCSCGTVNKGKFCAECGKPRP